MKTVYIDIYGADIGPEPIIRGALTALERYADLHICFIGDRDIITAAVNDPQLLESRVSIMHTTDYVTNDEPASCVFNGRDNSTIVMGLTALKQDENAIGFLSAGSTGALFVGSIFRLGLVCGLKTPALCSVIPCCDGKLLALLDCGANMDCRSQDLVNFALMGSALMKSLGESPAPRVALLSVGREDSKGNKLTQEAFSKISALPVNFIGNIEGLDVVSGEAEVIVADGFSGNILLKTIEAVGKSGIAAVNDALKNCDAAAKADLEKVKARLSVAYDFNPYGGASFLGTVKPVIKMHGSATEITPSSCIDQLIKMENANYRQGQIDALSLAQ